MNLEFLSKIGGLNVGYIELMDVDRKSLLFYAVNTDRYKTINSAVKGRINQIDYFTLRDLEELDRKKIKNNLLDFINKNINYKDREKDAEKIGTHKTALDILEEIKTARINFYRPEKTIPIKDHLDFKIRQGQNFTKKEINRINAFLIKTYKNYYGFCEYIRGLRNKN